MPFKTGSWGEQAKKRSVRRLEYFSEYSSKRYKRDRERIRARCRDYNKKNPLILKAEHKAFYAIVIPQGQICELCNEKLATLRHHPDYSKPLEVQFLCRSCHNKRGGG